MNDFIILEGCDGVGKTTLANLLIHKGYKSLHFDYDPHLSIKEKYQRILSKNYGANIVLDRSFISEMVYGPLRRGYSRLSDKDFSELLQMLNKRGGRVVLLDADPETIFDRIQKRGDADDKNIDLSQVTNIRNLYKQVLSSRQECPIDIIRNDREIPQNILMRLQLTEPPLQCLIFDFDETIYHPETTTLPQQLVYRMSTFIKDKFNLSYKEARELSRKYRLEYGSTVVGLQQIHSIDPKEFVDYSYNLDLSELKKDQKLKEQLHAIPEKKVILTNANEIYVEKALYIMGIRDEFSDIIGITRTNFVPKSNPVGYEMAIEEHADSGKGCVMFDDQATNLRMAKNYGMRTVLCHKNEDDLTGVDYISRQLNQDLINIVSKVKGNNR